MWLNFFSQRIRISRRSNGLNWMWWNTLWNNESRLLYLAHMRMQKPRCCVGSGGKGRKSRVRLGRTKAEMIRKSLEFSNLISVKIVLVLPDYFSPVDTSHTKQSYFLGIIFCLIAHPMLDSRILGGWVGNLGSRNMFYLSGQILFCDPLS